jgi:hypothetical protein
LTALRVPIQTDPDSSRPDKSSYTDRSPLAASCPTPLVVYTRTSCRWSARLPHRTPVPSALHSPCRAIPQIASRMKKRSSNVSSPVPATNRQDGNGPRVRCHRRRSRHRRRRRHRRCSRPSRVRRLPSCARRRRVVYPHLAPLQARRLPRSLCRRRRLRCRGWGQVCSSAGSIGARPPSRLSENSRPLWEQMAGVPATHPFSGRAHPPRRARCTPKTSNLPRRPRSNHLIYRGGSVCPHPRM